MSYTAVRVEGLGKRYRIGQYVGYKTIRESLTNAVSAPFRRLRPAHHEPSAMSHEPSRHELSSKPHELSAVSHELSANTLWALKDVSFEVKQGEAVGIIGRNGSGKSTLLKILSRITSPSEGRVEIRGRVGSLLEVGTGFHPELTGRENVYLNGAIIGMKKVEIDRRFDEIVAFAEIEKFLDTPVKRYSSGMYVRLAFAVAAHLEPEVLIVDEVLAVGDASFQKKCLGKMGDVAKGGRTVLFVSHNMAAITRLCPHAILLESGRVLRAGEASRVVSDYLESGLAKRAAREWPELHKAPGNDIVRLRAVRVRDQDGTITDATDIRKGVGIEIEYDVLQPGHVLVPNYHFFNEQGVCAFVASDLDPEWHRKPRSAGRYVSTAWIPGNFLSEGRLTVGAAVSTMDPVVIHFHEADAVAFQVIDSLEGDSARGDYAGPMPGVVRPLLRCTTQFSPHDQATTGPATGGTVT
ncbi:MAG: ABC transporter ATP-binding protein [Chloroflexi bacterium]|nr:ABC transporter ATP-binding protein [Chloroflexota bacterium]